LSNFALSATSALTKKHIWFWKLGKSQQNLNQFKKKGRLVSRKMIDRLQFFKNLSVISKPSAAASGHECQHPGNLTKI